MTPALSTSDAALFQAAVIPKGYTAADTLRRVGRTVR